LEKFKLPDTGQTFLYDENGKIINNISKSDKNYGQDACYLRNKMKYKKLDYNGNEIKDNMNWENGFRMVKDENTGLIWEVKSNEENDINNSERKYNWEEAKEYVKNLNDIKYCGRDDWRLPNKDELRSIINYELDSSAVDSFYFPNITGDFYWTNNIYKMQSYFAWGISLGIGSATALSQHIKKHTIAVSGGYNSLFGTTDESRFVDNGDGTITDKVTNLMWQKGENPRMNWHSALNYCKNMNLAGYNDWRMPNIKELNTILNLDYSNNWWYFKNVFPAEGLNPPLLHYFSSTTYKNTYAWVTNFCFGYDGYYAGKNAHLLFRAVRNADSEELNKNEFKLPSCNQYISYDDEGNSIQKPSNNDRFFGQASNYCENNGLKYIKMREQGLESDETIEYENGLKMVKDENTGLIWETKSPCKEDINCLEKKYTWKEAFEFIKELNKTNYGGFSDWRLPNKEELRTIVDYSENYNTVDRKYFKYNKPDFYWAKDTYKTDVKLKWGIYFGYGCGIVYSEDLKFYVRAVRGGYNTAFGESKEYNLIDNGDGTITDLNTNLMWKKDEPEAMTWEEALKYCENLELGGCSDWRLPNMKELGTILDVNESNEKWFDKKYFPDVKTAPLGFYMSSNTFNGTFGWGINFQFGYDGYYADKKRGKYSFRPVRSIK